MRTAMVRRKGATHVAFVHSDTEASTEYQISRLPDGSLACACYGFAFCKARPRTCKHLQAYLGIRDGAGIAMPDAARHPEQRRVMTPTETFTFKRGISLDGLVPGGG